MKVATNGSGHGTKNRLDHLAGSVPTNGAAATIAAGEPFTLDATIHGVADLIMHRWNCEAVAAKAGSAKGSKAKKSDDVESYVYRNDKGEICIPGEYIRQSVIWAAKFKQDPRSPRKSAMDLMKAALLVEPNLATLGVKSWDYLDTRRVVVQRNGISRTRPAMRAGWTFDVSITVLLPEYVNQDFLVELLNTAGRLIGIGDFRPTYGRFVLKSFAAR
jgi:hypothetical protein